MFTSKHYRVLRELRLTWNFRLKSICPAERVVICDLTSEETKLVILSVEGSDEADAIVKAVELALHRDNGDGPGW